MSVRAWIAVAAFIVWSAALLCSGWYAGGLSGRLTAANRSADLALEKLEASERREAEQIRIAKATQKKLDKLPRSQGVIREVIRENPSGCELPAAVADKLREAIRKANASREMPADPVGAEQQRRPVDRERTGPAD
jgi:hypothetical protein